MFPNVFTSVFSFLVGRPTHMHAFFHSCKPLANFFVQVMVFYETTCVSFKWTSMKPLHSLELSSILCCFRHNMPKTRTNERSGKFQRKKQVTTNGKVMVRDARLDPSSLMSTMILSIKPKEPSKTCNSLI